MLQEAVEQRDFHFSQALKSMNPTCIKEIKDSFRKYGYVIIKNIDTREFSEFSYLSSLFFDKGMDYFGGTNSRENLGNGVLSVGTEPPSVPVDAHNEMSYWNTYPEIIMFACKSCPPNTGATVIADNHAVSRDILKTAVGKKFQKFGVNYIRNFTDHNSCGKNPGLKSWQQTFGYEDKDSLISYLNRAGIHHEFSADGGLRVSYQLPAYEYDPIVQTNLLFVSTGNHGRAFDLWAPFNQLENKARPYHLQYGDGSELSRQDLEDIDAIFSLYSMPINWLPSMAAIIDNRRFTHARPVFTPNPSIPRELGVQIGNQVSRIGIRKNAWTM